MKDLYDEKPRESHDAWIARVVHEAQKTVRPEDVERITAKILQDDPNPYGVVPGRPRKHRKSTDVLFLIAIIAALLILGMLAGGHIKG